MTGLFGEKNDFNGFSSLSHNFNFRKIAIEFGPIACKIEPFYLKTCFSKNEKECDVVI